MKYIPYTFPSTILEFLHKHMNEQAKNLKEGEPIVLDFPTISDYYNSIPEKWINKYENVYPKLILRTYQMMTHEGLITPLGNAIGFEEKYRSNGFKPMDLKYGKYDFLIFGFQYIHDTFEDAVRPVIINPNSKEKSPDIGTGFVINASRSFDANFYFITARHCLPYGDRIYVPAFLPPKESCVPEAIWMPVDEDIDIAIIKFDMKKGIPGREHNFWLSTPEILDEVLTMGYPPIQGFIDAIQVAEVARISSFLRSTHGRVTGEGKHYGGGLEDHFLISARVKGGNSGGPVINKNGEVVGIVIEHLKQGDEIDLLGYGVALNASIIQRILNTIEGKENSIEIAKVDFAVFDDGFEIKK